MIRGSLIAFEGLDGCGKSTQLDLLAAVLRARHDVLVTREPTDGPMGRRLREHARSGDRVSAEQEFEWFMEDRREHVRDTILPALQAGTVVLTDRYTLSSVAYQGARGLDPASILAANEAEFPLPDLALLFEVEPAVGLERVRARGGVAEPAFEEIQFQSEVEKVYTALECPYLVRIDARRTPEEVHENVLQVVERIGNAR